VNFLGEQTEFNPGNKAPNDGMYTEIGENDFHMGINNPRRIALRAGQRFPQTSNPNRKWHRFRK
jgi:hypothetical protein